MKQSITIEVDIPDGFEFDRYAPPTGDDYYYDHIQSIVCPCLRVSIAPIILLKKKARAPQVGDVYIRSNEVEYTIKGVDGSWVFCRVAKTDRCICMEWTHFRDAELIQEAEPENSNIGKVSILPCSSEGDVD